MANTKTIVEALTTVFTKYGVANLDEIKTLLANPELAKVTVSDEVFSSLGQELLTVEAAKNHRDVSHHFKGKYNRILESGVKKSLKSLGADEALYKDWDDSAEETTIKLDAALKQYKEQLSKTGTGEGDKTKLKEYADKVNELTIQLGKKDEEIVNREKTLRSEFDNQQLTMDIQRQLSGYNYSEAYERDEVDLLVMTKLNSSPYIFKREADKSIGVYQKENPDLKAVGADNKPLALKGILDSTVAKYTKKKDAENNNGGGNDNKNNGSNGGTNNGSNNNSNEFVYGSEGQKKLAEDRAKFDKIVGKND